MYSRMHCKSLWIKASAKCIHVNVNIIQICNRPIWVFKKLIHVTMLHIVPPMVNM